MSEPAAEKILSVEAAAELVNEIVTLRADRDRLAGELEKLQIDRLGCIAANARIAELENDRGRMEWLESHARFITTTHCSDLFAKHDKTLRVAIDAEMRSCATGGTK
jgi:hypothetical protein